LQVLLGDDPSLAPLTQLLIARTEGNPFFLEESVRTLVETGVLVGEAGAYRLAHHALRGEVWDKAITYCQQAGARAHDRAAFREAAASFEQALQALAHLPEHNDTRGLALEICLALGGALFGLGEYGRCLALLGEAETLARALDDRVRLAQVLARTARVLRMTGDHDGAMAASRQALELASALGETVLQLEASLYLGLAYYGIGDFSRAAELLRRNVEAADRESGTPSTDVRNFSRAWLALSLSALGAFAEGRRHGEEALRLATLEGRGGTPILVHACLGLLYLAQGNLEHAIRVYDQGLTLCRASSARAGCDPSRRAWAMPLRSRDAWRRGAHFWRSRSAKVSTRAGCSV
jgi:tetratricopeptide (TPR) repeat protein